MPDASLSRRTRRRRALILHALAERGPMPAGELDAVTGRRTVLPDLWPLVDEGQVATGTARLDDGTWGVYYRLAEPHDSDKEGD
jgi:DNA-binding transcriptional ArsR family regulator